jgi:hypothetical protein
MLISIEELKEKKGGVKKSVSFFLYIDFYFEFNRWGLGPSGNPKKSLLGVLEI